MHTPVRRLIPASLAFLALTSVGAAQTVAVYEGFNYTAGTSLTTQSSGGGGAGFSANWGSGGPNFSVNGTSLSFTDSVGNGVTTTGGSITDPASAGTGTANNTRGFQSNTYLNRSSSLTSGSLWFSTLFQPTTDSLTTAGGVFIGLYTAATSQPLIRFANITGSSTVSSSLGVSMTTGNYSTISSASLTAGTTYMLIGKVDWTSGNDTLSFWVLPSGSGNLSSETALGAANGTNTTTSFATSFERIRFQSLLASGSLDATTYDEFRMGNSFSDVISVSAIPEPSTYAALAGAAMLGFAVWRRRRSRAG